MLKQKLEKALSEGHEATDALQQTFRTTDEELKSIKDKSGSTAAVALIMRDHDDTRKLYTANVGDARIVLR